MFIDSELGVISSLVFIDAKLCGIHRQRITYRYGQQFILDQVLTHITFLHK
jgi:hypothetical protein